MNKKPFHNFFIIEKLLKQDTNEYLVTMTKWLTSLNK